MKLLIITQKVDREDQLLGFFIDWIKEFSNYFESIEVLCLEKGKYVLPSNVKVVSLGKDSNASKIKILFNFISEVILLRSRYDKVFVHMNPIWVVVGALFWKLFCKPIFLWYAHKSVTTKLKLAEALADGVICSTPEGFRLNSEKVYYVGQGIDVTRFRPQKELLKPNSILSVGRISKSKNHETIIKTLKVLKNLGQDFFLTIVGEAVLKEDFEYEKNIRKLVSDLNLEESVRFLGKVKTEDLPPQYQSHKFYINTSTTGSLDKTILEAMACGCLTLSSNDAARNILPADLAISDQSPESIAGKILELNSGNKDFKLFEYVKNNHSLEKLARSVFAILSQSGVFIAGYSYVRENYRRTFDFYSNPEKIIFLLPKKWKTKKGNLVFEALSKDNVLTTKTFFYHSNYPIIGGILKGWMPLFPYYLWKNRNRVSSVFTVLEPMLLSSLYQAFWTKFFGKKHILFTWENVEYGQFSGGLVHLLRRLILALNKRMSDGLICGNKKALDVHKDWNMQKEVIPLSGVDENRFTKTNLGPKESIDILFAGALDFRKGIHVLISAFGDLTRELPHVRLNLVGSGTYENEIRNQIQTSIAKDKITLTSWINNSNLPELFQKNDIFVYPSIAHEGWEEQFGYSMAEASLSGLPVIATKTGSIEDLVIDNVTGIIVPPNDTHALKEALKKLILDASLREILGVKGRDHIIGNYSHKVIAKKFESFFNLFNG